MKREPIKKKGEVTAKNQETEKKPVMTKVDDFEASLLLDLNKEFDESTTILEDATSAQVTAWIPSGNPVLDAALGGGWPCGRIVEIFGPESHGKTTVALHAIAETQKLGGTGIFLDSEYALDKRRAKAIGVDLKRLIYANPDTMEDLFEYVEFIIKKIKEKDPDRFVTIVWDSVAATATKSEIEGDYGEATMGIHARIMSQALRKITKEIAKNKVLFICINQVREKLNVTYGDKTTTFGGRALRFYASIRLEVQKIGQYKEGGEVRGIQCKATTKKNKVAPPFREANFNILFRDENGGMDAYTAVLDAGFELGMFGSSKGWYEINGKKYRASDAIAYYKEHPDEWKAVIDTYLSMS